MVKKGNQRRLTITQDIWSALNLNDDCKNDLGFFKTDDGRICITFMYLGYRYEYEFICKCTITDKHRFFIPTTIDTYLGEGDFYFFTAQLSRDIIYLYKLGKNTIQEIQKENFFKCLA